MIHGVAHASSSSAAVRQFSGQGVGKTALLFAALRRTGAGLPVVTQDGSNAPDCKAEPCTKLT
jgi:hypothetical protein